MPRSYLKMDEARDAAEMKYLLASKIRRRKEEIQNYLSERRTEINKRIRYRRHLFQNYLRTRTSPSPDEEDLQNHVPIPADPDWWERVVMAEFGPEDWLDKFHVTRDIFFLLSSKLKPQLEQAYIQQSGQTITLERCIAMALMRLSTSTEYCFISELFGVPISAVCQCVREVCEAIILLLKPLYMQLPAHHELEEHAEQFQTQWGFPHCIGVIDSLHIPIQTPSTDTQDCWNPRGWPSVVLQCLVNAQGTFWDVCSGFTGSTDDMTILQSSELWTMAEQGGLCPQPPKELLGQPLGFLLLGDASYSQQTWLLKCYPPAPSLTPQQQTFNIKLNHCHKVIEHAFQRLKARWQCLHNRNDSNLDLVSKMAVACCILHNICNVHNIPFKEEWIEALSQNECPQPTDVSTVYIDDPNAEAARSLLCNYFEQEQQSNPSNWSPTSSPVLPIVQEPPQVDSTGTV
ncbi:putative nuclease HARBI1 [Myxocyprinus asiaticus]|uniref:putative nuclease HARBI1 n=1 Tax=Myxocyprinus asiaticus TaxID=70543 RepID=UPI002223D587|nr:putative nuclease HARBI1 [Myxocyprinus asiaticus]